MTPQERDLILEVAQRLRGTRLPEKDPEAERLIRAEIGSQPDALYLLTQAVIVQEQGLRAAQERIRELEAGRGQGGAPGRGSFLAGLTGGAPAPAPPPPAAAPAPASPAGPSGVGSFLRTAAAAAAGVVGGQLIFDGMRHLFGGGPGLPWDHGAGATPNAPFFGGAFGGAGAGEAYPATPGRHPSRPDPWQADEDTPSGGDFAGAGGDFGDDNGASGGDFGEADEDESSDTTGAGGDFDAPDDSAGGDFGSDDFGDDSAGGGDF